MPTDLRGERFEVSGIEHGVCSGCGEIYLSLDAGELLQKRVAALARAARGLLAPDEIRVLRQSLGLSQSGFERLLGLGPKTVVRWEKGTVFQGAAADRLMRLLHAMPSLVSVRTQGRPRMFWPRPI